MANNYDFKDAADVTKTAAAEELTGSILAGRIVGAAAHDAAAAGAPLLVGGYAKAAAPSDVSADADAVNAWFLRNGAQAVVLTAAGALIGGDATNGVDVDVTRLPALPAGTNNIGDVDVLTLPALAAGEAFIGAVGGRLMDHTVTLSLDTSAYASGDVLADTQQMDAVFRKTDGTGVIRHVTVFDQDDQKVAMTVYFLSANVAMGTENAAPSISDANALNICGRVKITAADYDDLGGVGVACVPCDIPVKAVSGTDDLYIAVVNGTGTPTFTASGVKVRVTGILD